MARGTGKAVPDDLLTCERCHGFYAVEVPDDGEPRVRCNVCGHVREVPTAPIQKEGEGGKQGKWTVIGPDGKTMTFPSWEKLVESRHPSATTEAAAPTRPASATHVLAPKAEEKKPSASALLDVTPTPALPKLTLAELDSDPHLLAASPSPHDLAKSLAKSNPPPRKGPEWAPLKSKAPPALAPETTPPVSVREIDSSAVVEDHSDDEPAPLSLRDAIAIVDEDDEPAPLSLRDAIVDDEPGNGDDDVPHETVSLRDVQVIPPADDSGVDSTPPPPARGVLRTLPPTGPKDRATAPPPTITVEEPPASKRPVDKAVAKEDKPTKVGSKAKPAAKSDASKTATNGAAKKTASSKTTGATSAKDEQKPVASAKAPVAEEEPKRGWVLPSLVVAGVAVVIWRMMAASPETTQQETPTPTVATTAAPTPTPADSAPAPAPPASETASAPAETSATPAAATEAPTATATTTAVATTVKKAPAAPGDTETAPPPEKKPAAAAESGMSMSDMLDRAGSARRSGDFATARDLYERVLKMNPGNVEANGGLGDVARAQGDLAAAKTSYERALAASPAYGPAQLGLADTEWDLGNRAGAQRRYAQIVERLGDRAPERAKQRGAITE